MSVQMWRDRPSIILAMWTRLHGEQILRKVCRVSRACDFCRQCRIFTARRLAKRGICRRRVSVCVCVCVCVSVTLRYCIKTAKRRITKTTPHDSPLTQVFWHQSSLRNSKGITPYGGEKCRWGGLNFVTFDENRAITRKRYKIDIYM